jgi:hypothetical protein
MEKEKETRVLASSPDYEEINLLSTKIAMLKNPHLHHKIFHDVPQAELKAALIDLEQELQELLDFQGMPFNRALVTVSGD